MIAVMAIYVVPKFKVFFAELDVELPLLTRIMLGVSRRSPTQRTWSCGSCSGCARRRRSSCAAADARDAGAAGDRPAASCACRCSGRCSTGSRCRSSRRSLATLLAGGIPLVPALEIAVASVGNA